VLLMLWTGPIPGITNKKGRSTILRPFGRVAAKERNALAKVRVDEHRGVFAVAWLHRSPTGEARHPWQTRLAARIARSQGQPGRPSCWSGRAGV